MEGHNLKVSFFATCFKNVSASFTLELKSPLCLQERMFHKVVPLYAMELRMMLVLKSGTSSCLLARSDRHGGAHWILFYLTNGRQFFMRLSSY